MFSSYRLFLIGLGFAMALLLWLFLDRSRLGAMVRAGVDDAAMAAGLGANIPALFTGIFGAGVALAALGGVAAGPVLGLYPGMDTEILIPAYVDANGRDSLGRGLDVASIAAAVAADRAVQREREALPHQIAMFAARYPETIDWLRGKLEADLDLYNLGNSDAILAQNNTFGATWTRPTLVIQPRFVKFTVRYDF